MNNLALKDMMWTAYRQNAYTNKYILGFAFRGVIYAVITTDDVVENVISLTTASRGKGMRLRFKPTVEQKIYLLSQGANVICSEKYFSEIVANSQYNKGEIFEKLITEKTGQEWYKDYVPFNEGADLYTNGYAFQIKFENATITTEKTLSRL